jgi:hypothetical protein
MSFTTSDELRRDQESRQLHEPPMYNHRRSVQALFRIAIPVLVLGLALLIGLVWIFSFKWYFLPIPFVAAFFSYREYYKWAHNHITCNPKDGVLRIQECSQLWLGITGSNDDQHPLGDANLDTPTRSVFDAYIFHCCTLVIGKRRLRDVKYVDDLLDIQQFRESLSRHEAELSQDQLNVDLASLMNLETVVTLLTEIRDLLGPQTRQAHDRGVAEGRAAAVEQMRNAQAMLQPAQPSEDTPS